MAFDTLRKCADDFNENETLIVNVCDTDYEMRRGVREKSVCYLAPISS